MWLVGTSPVSGNLPVRLAGGEYIVGRTKRAQIVLADPTVSRRHARLLVEGERITVMDLGSANGTFVNECSTTEGELALGDLVRFGHVTCTLSAWPLSPAADQESTFPARKLQGKTAIAGRLTPTQQTIADHIVQGRDEQEIAVLLDKSPHTIHTHLKAIFQRLGVHSRAELIVKLMGRD
jgi:DNA-binding CsgD family transcriptional regulator